MVKKLLSKTKSDNIQLYEVIRIIEGIPVFLEDHLDRLYHSARLTGMYRLPGPVSLAVRIKKYVADEKKDAGNIKLNFSFNNSSAEPQFELNFIPHYYPTEEEYSNGVKVGLLYADRPIPHAKVQNSDIRDRANQSIKDSRLFEVLLIDSEGNITEGSRSNVLFIKNEKLYSSPGEKILKGITRTKVLRICENEGIQVIETTIPVNELDIYDAAFLTGTSPKVLPISSINKIVYKTDLVLQIKLQWLYNQLIESYIKERRR
ncbi:MAG: aminotransferase class IV [Bacteroidia bacterium]|nr:aminotransferase class IV [Bacteroidia bacterium]